MAPRMKVETDANPAVESAAGSKTESSATKQKNTAAEPKKTPTAPKPRIDVPASQSKPATASAPAAASKAAPQTESKAAPRANKVKPTVAVDTPAASVSTNSSASSSTSASSAASSAKPKAATKAAAPKRTTQTSKPKIVAASTETVQDDVARNDVATGNSTQYDAYTAQASSGDQATTGDQGFSGATQEKMSPKNIGASMSGWVHRTFPGHEHAFVGGMVALLLALLTFIIGPLRVLFICIVVVIGIALGQIADGDPKIIRMIRGLFDNDRDQR